MVKQYSQLIEKIDEYLDKEDVVLSDKFISAYSLYNIINDELSILRDINKNSSFIPKGYSLKIYSSVFDDSFRLKFFFTKTNRSHRDIFIRNISKDRKINKFTFKNDLDQDFMLMYEKEIKQIFDIKEKFYNEFKLDKETKLFKDKFLEVLIYYDELGEVNIKIKFASNENVAQLSSKFWILYSVLMKKIENNKIDILKKFPIKIDSLDNSTKLLLENHLRYSDKKVKIKRDK